MKTATTLQLPSVLELISVTASDMGFKGFADGKQLEHMITDGSFAIKRDALKGQTKLPQYILAAMNAPLTVGISQQNVKALAGNYEVSRMTAVEPMQNKIGAYKGPGGKLVATMEFIRCGSADESTLTVNAKYLKMIWNIFPACEWYVSPNNLLCLVDGSEILAVLAPILSK